jgi:excisionase family DNA binding protein
MDNTNKNIELPMETLREMRRVLYGDLRRSLLKDLDDKIKGSVSNYVGSMLEFPLTIKQTAKLTGRSDKCIYKMCQRGVIPYTKRGGQVHINMKDISSALILGEETTE